MTKLKELFQRIQIGYYTAKNRIVLPPMILGEATPDGYVTPNMIRRYRDIAEGGIGMMVVEGVAVNTSGSKGIGGLIASNKNMQGLAKIAEELSLRGVVSVMQVLHCGRQALPEANGGVQPVSVSDVPYWMGDKFAPTPREATLNELEEIKREFINASILAQNAGFNGIEIHCAHGYILATFLSAKANTRADKYGGDFTARMAYPLEVVAAVRKATNPKFIVGARISANYAVGGEPTVDDMLLFAKELEKVGIDYLSVSGGTYESHWKQSPPCYIGRNSNVEESERIKKEMSIPVMVAGGICYPDEANDIIKTGKADMVCMGRAIFADPDLPNKLKMDKAREIRPCIRCNLEFADTFKQHQARCSVNFQMGRESEYALTPALVKKRIMVVGGGPGGMEAARVAALRGHAVELYEQSDRLGGSLLVASEPEHKEEIGRLIEYFLYQMELCGVRVHTGIAVTPELITKAAPDALVVSTGAKPFLPPIPGLSGNSALMGEDVLMRRVQTVEPVMVAGGGCVGIDLAFELTEQGKKVIMVELAPCCGADLDVISRSAVNVRFAELIKDGRLELYTDTALKEAGDGYALLSLSDGTVEKKPIGSLVVAMGYTPAPERCDTLTPLVGEVYLIGDAAGARRIRHAIHEGFVAGYSV